MPVLNRAGGPAKSLMSMTAEQHNPAPGKTPRPQLALYPILEPIDDLKEIILIVRGHHENYDGSGYPEGKAGEEIPLGSRIIAVADAFDAITTTRPYHKARGKKFAAGELRENTGRQFDPKVVAAFLRTLGGAGSPKAEKKS